MEQSLNILYITQNAFFKEDLKDFSNSLYILEDGIEAIDFFYENKNIDVVLCDIDIKRMNGLELLEKIKDIDENVPFIFVLEDISDEDLVKAISFKVDGIVLNPLNFKDITRKIEEINISNYRYKPDYYQSLISNYLEAINKIAIVFVFDSSKNITYVNDFYKEVSKLNSEDIYHKEYSLLYHKDISQDFIQKQWQELNLKNRWNGTLKYKTNSEAIFHTNCTILTIKDKSRIKYISINFITSKVDKASNLKDENVLYDFQETRKIYKVAQSKINLLNKELALYDNIDEKELARLILDNKNYLKNIDKLENKIKDLRLRQENFVDGVNCKVKEIFEYTNEMKSSILKMEKMILHLQREIKVKDTYILRFKDMIEEKKFRINALEDVLEHRQSQLKALEYDLDFEHVLSRN